MDRRYRPVPDEDVENMVWTAEDNPLPITEALNRALAMETEGITYVWIESKESFDKLLPILRVRFQNSY